MPDEQRKLALSVEVNESRAKKARQRIDELIKKFTDLDAAVLKYGEIARMAEPGSPMALAMRKQALDSIRGNTEAIKELEAAEKDLAVAQKGVNQETQKTVSLNQQVRRSSQELIQAKFAASRLGSAFTGLGLPEVGGAVSGAGNLASLAAQLPRLTSAAQGAPAAIAKTASALLGVEVSFGAVVAAAAPVLVAFAAVSVAYKKFQNDLTAAKKALDSARDAQRLYFETIASGTTETIEQARQEAEQRRQIITQQLEAQRGAFEQLDATQRLLAGGNIRKGIRELEAELAAATFEVNALDTALQSAEVAARDAAEAERQRAEELIQAVERASEIEQQRLDLIAEGTSQQYEDRIQQIERERATIERQIAQLQQFDQENEVYTERIQELRLRLGELNNEQDRLTDGTYALIRAREREAEAVEKAKKIQEELAAFTEDVADIESKIADTREESLRKLTQQAAEAERGIEVNLGRANEKAARQLEDQIAKLTREQGDKEAEVRTESADKIIELEKKAAKERERILKNYNRAASNAIRDRDAAALTAAQEARDDQLDQTQDQLDESKAKEKKALEDKLKEEERSYRRRLRELQIAHNNELRENRIAASQRLQDLRRENELRRQEINYQLDRQLRDEINTRNEAFAKQLQQLGIHNINMNNLTAAGLQAIARQFEAFYNRVAGAGVRTGSQDTVIFPGGKTLGHFQTGGIIPKTGPYMMHAGEPVLPSVDALRGLLADQARGRAIGGGGQSLSLTLEPGAVVWQSMAPTSRGAMRDFERVFPRLLIKAFKDMAA